MNGPTIHRTSPQISQPATISSTMLDVIIALVPALAMAVFLFGVRVLALTAVSVGTCVLAEYRNGTAVALLWASLPAAINLHRNSTKLVWFSFVYGIVHALTLFWVVPYALVTVGNSRWLTRIGANSAGKF